MAGFAVCGFLLALSATPADFDCSARALALDVAVQIQKHITDAQVRSIADALNGSPEAQCRNITASIRRPSSAGNPTSKVPLREDAIVASPSGDDSSGKGTLQEPLRSLEAAVALARHSRRRTITLRGGVYRLSSTLNLEAADSGLTVESYQGEPAVVSGAVELHPSWMKANGTNVWVTSVPGNLSFAGLRVNGRPAIKARYPNADPWRSLNPVGFITAATKWLPPKVTDTPVDYIVSDPRWSRNDTKGPRQYTGGIGGPCAHLEPPYGYWCSSKPPRSPDQGHRSPSGLDFSHGQLPHAPYANPEGAIVHACNLANCWFTWAFEVEAQNGTTLTWNKGGFQVPAALNSLSGLIETLTIDEVFGSGR